MNILLKILNSFKGLAAGKDDFGNCYFQSRTIGKNGKKKRWVVYNGVAEASKIPPQWHGWLHYTFDHPITSKTHFWQKHFLPNLTGTSLAYFPPGHHRNGGKREKATGDYEAWQPE